MKQYIYAEDHQMYYTTYVLFETDANISIEQMEKISYEPMGAGRFSTSFNAFKTLMENYSYTIKEIRKFDKINDYENIEVVIGATGNY